MPSSSRLHEVERARPWLGTLVSVRVETEGADACRAAIEAAFAEISLVHRLMSFHEKDSELSALHREALREPVQVSLRTFEVLAWAQELSRLSEGVFDVVRAAALAFERGALPRPDGTREIEAQASWRDIELIPELSAVRFQRPLLLDLGGVAKGYAVDRAIEVLEERGVTSATVNAGGDLRAIGSQRVALRAPPSAGQAAMVELSDAALASSGGEPDPGRAPGLHFDGAAGEAAPAGRFVGVIAQTCMTADSLTKVVMARGERCESLLAKLDAGAWVLDPPGPWREFGAVD